MSQTPIVDAATIECNEWPGTRCTAAPLAQQLERDCLILALRLMGEDESTLSPETAEVMARWRPKIEAMFEEVAK